MMIFANGSQRYIFLLLTLFPCFIHQVSSLLEDNGLKGNFAERAALLQDRKLTSSYQKGNVARDEKTEAPLAVYGFKYEVEGIDDPKTVADLFLLENMSLLRIENSSNIRDHRTRMTRAGTVVRYKQICNGVDVFESEIAITVNKKNIAKFVAGSFRSNMQCPNVIPKFGKDESISAAIIENGIPQRDLEFIEANLIIYTDDEESYLTWQVIACGIKERYESNEYMYDAMTGDLLRTKSLLMDKKGSGKIIKYKKPSKFSGHTNMISEDPRNLRGSSVHSKDVFSSKLEKRIVFQNMDQNNESVTRKDGTALVFDPNPLATARAKYSDPGFEDNCDFSSTELKKQLKEVTLHDLLYEKGMYFLNGKYAQYQDFDLPLVLEIPSLGLDFDTESKSSKSDFSSDRRHGRFEATSAFYFIEKYLRYMDEELDIKIEPWLYDGGIRFDPRGALKLDNSYYDPPTQRLAFGEGGVDDAEDSDVVIHELGHFIHDALTSGSFSTVQGLSEGFSDFVANSYVRSTGLWTPDDEEYYWVFQWDGHNEFWDGRITNYGAKFPKGLQDNLHMDGQIFSSCCMKVWDLLGAKVCDELIFTGMSFTVSSSNQNIAVIAIMNAAEELGIPEEDLEAIRSIYRDCGYVA